MSDDDFSKAMERLGINEESAKVIRDGEATHPLSRKYIFCVPKGARPWGKGRLFDPYAESIEKLKKVKAEFADTFRDMASVAASVLGGTREQGQVEPPSGDASAHRLGEFGGEIGNDNLARFQAPTGTRPKDLEYIVYRNAIVMRARGVERVYSYREAGLHDRKKKQDPKKENRFHELVEMIFAGGGILSWGENSWQGRGDPRTRWRKSSSDPDRFELTDEMATLNGPDEKMKTTKKDFQKRLRLMTGLEGEFFHDYAEVGGYKPCFKLMDRRNENAPCVERSSERLAVTEAENLRRKKVDEKLLRDAAVEAEQWQQERRGRGTSRSEDDEQ